MAKSVRSNLKFPRIVFWLSVFLATRCCGDAATFFVTRSTDGSFFGTLRGAVLTANHRGGNNTIVLAGDQYHLTAEIWGDELSITNGILTIIGVGSSREADHFRHSTRATIDSDDMTRFFHVFPGARLMLQNLVLTGGGFYAEKSGAIKNEGTLVLENCVIQGSSALIGAGIYNSGRLTMNNDVVSGNSCYGEEAGSGGGIYNVGTLIANDCIVSNNASGKGRDGGFFGGIGVSTTIVGPQPSISGGNAGDGGGIFNAGAMTLNRCFIMDNSTGQGGSASSGAWQGANGGAGGNGAGIYNMGRLKMNRCVIGGNTGGDGGAGAAGGSGGFENTGYNGGNGGSGGSGGGVFNAPGFTAQSFNSLIALNAGGSGGSAGAGYPGYPGFISAGTDGNPGTNGFGRDLSGSFISSGYNLVGAADYSTGFTNGVQHDIVGSRAAPASPTLFKLK
jgi:hypothetical protein